MDLTLPLIGVLGLVGYNMNSTINTRNYTKKRTKVPSSELNNGENVYNARSFSRIRKAELDQVRKIRNNNEQISVNQKSDAMPVKKKVTFQEKSIDSYSQAESVTPNNKIYKGPMFSAEKYFIPAGDTSQFKINEGFSNISSLTGEETNFSHQNMTPFFGGKVKSGVNSETLGRYTGRDLGEKKTEVINKLNGPVDNVHGNVLFTDSISQDRFIVPNMATGMIPFEQVRVKPIPSEYNRGSSKTLEELIVNPKQVLEGRLNVGQAIGRRGLQGELKKVSRETTYQLGKARQFITTGAQPGKYYEDTDHFRQSKKNLIAETKLHQLGKVDLSKSIYKGVTKVEDGVNTLVRDATKQGQLNDWIRSARVSQGVKNLPTKENIRLRVQERADTTREYMGNAIKRVKASKHRIIDDLKTTNKELNLYSYKGIAEGLVKNPHEREAWYSNESKTKNSMQYTPGGAKQGAPGVGVDDFHYETKQTVIPENRLEGASSIIKRAQSYGNVTKSRFEGQEKDYSDRHSYVQKRSYDRPDFRLE